MTRQKELEDVREKMAKQILSYEFVYSIALIESNWAKATDREKKEYLDKTGQILAFIKQAGYVRLDPNQSLPALTLENATQHDASEPWCAGNFTDSLQAFGKKSQKEMLNAGWRKVILK